MSSYYGRPILKQPIWGPAVAAYFFTGGLAGMSGALSFMARVRGNRALAKSALGTSVAGLGVSLPLLVLDLGKPERFLNMLRVVKPTSPMSIGSWILSGFSAATGVAVASELAGAIRPHGLMRPLDLMRPLGLVAQGASALLGTGVATYTAVLVSDTAVPAWHEGRREMPFIFAGSASASAGGAAAILTPTADAGPARRLAVGGAVVEVAASELMKRRLGPLARPYEEGPVKVLDQLSTGLTVGGAILLGTLGRKRPAAVIGGTLLLAGSLCKRFAIFRAGFESARQTTDVATEGPMPRSPALDQSLRVQPVSSRRPGTKDVATTETERVGQQATPEAT
jgi:formate-dependent nitrite reductase membrane component NrfD